MKLTVSILLLTSSMTMAQTMKPKYGNLIYASDVEVTKGGIEYKDRKGWDSIVYFDQGKKKDFVHHKLKSNAKSPSPAHQVISIKKDNKMTELIEQRVVEEVFNMDKNTSNIRQVDNMVAKFTKSGELRSFTNCENRYNEKVGLLPNQRKSGCVTVTPKLCQRIYAKENDVAKLMEDCKRANSSLAIGNLLTANELKEFEAIQKTNHNQLLEKSKEFLPKTSKVIPDINRIDSNVANERSSNDNLYKVISNCEILKRANMITKESDSSDNLQEESNKKSLKTVKKE